MAEIITLMCTQCKARNYTTSRSKKTSSLALKKYCKFCRQHTLHKEK